MHTERNLPKKLARMAAPGLDPHTGTVGPNWPSSLFVQVGVHLSRTGSEEERRWRKVALDRLGVRDRATMEGPKMNAKCGACGETHPTIADYRACAAATPAAPLSEIGARMVRSAGIPASEIEESRERWRTAPAELESARLTAPSQPIRKATITEPSRSGYAQEHRVGYSAPREERKATEPMARYVKSLLQYRDIPAHDATPVSIAVSEDRLTFNVAKRFIDAYKDAPNKPKEAPAAPAAPALPDVPAGRYAIRTDGVVKFYVLDRPESGKWAGYVFLKAQASDEKWPIKSPTAKAEILGRISEDIEGAAVLYGQELGKCYRCGRALTDETSRSLGIGPDCRSK